MTRLGLVLADLRHRPLNQAMTVLLLATGLALLLLLLAVSTQVRDRLDRNSRGIDAVVGAKGSPLQLILSAVHHLDVPTGNLPLAEARALAADPRVAQAIPLALGDSVRGFRIVGTEPALLAQYGARIDAGRVWAAPMEAVIGSEVAAAGLALEARFRGVHGLGAGGRPHAGHDYRVVGVLAPTGSVADRLIFTALESVWALHAAPGSPRDRFRAAPDADPGHGPEDDHGHDHDHAHGDESAAEPAPSETQGRDVTAVLIRYRSPLAALSFPREINERSRLVAAAPALETARLLALAGIGLDTLRALALLLLAASGLSLFIALMQLLERRRHDLAVFRALGATRADLWVILWLSAALPGALATLLGIVLGHGALALLAARAPKAEALRLDATLLAPGEVGLWLLPLALATLAVAIPAWRASRIDVADALSER